MGIPHFGLRNCPNSRLLAVSPRTESDSEQTQAAKIAFFPNKGEEGLEMIFLSFGKLDG